MGGFDGETHHGFIDGADLFDVEGAVGDAFAVENEELLECAVDGAVGDERRLDSLVDLARATGGSPLEELEAVRGEEDPVAPG